MLKNFQPQIINEKLKTDKNKKSYSDPKTVRGLIDALLKIKNL